MTSVGLGIEFEVTKEGKLVLEIDLNEHVGPSKSGKMNAFANTNGFLQLPGVESPSGKPIKMQVFVGESIG